MILLLAGLAGAVAALLVHWLTWYLRLNHLTLAVILGVISAALSTAFFLLFRTSENANLMIAVLVVFWVFALLVGILQARSILAPWWKGVLAFFFELALTFALGVAVQLSAQRYSVELGEQFPGIPISLLMITFLVGLGMVMLLLAVLRLSSSQIGS